MCKQVVSDILSFNSSGGLERLDIPVTPDSEY